MTPKHMNGVAVLRRGNTVFIPLPVSLWKSCGPCHCDRCKGREGFWDTVAVAEKPNRRQTDTTWTVHMPELHGGGK